MTVMRFNKLLTLVTAGACLWAGVVGSHADSPDNPYAAITARNVFGLKDPPPAGSTLTNAVPAAPPNIKITGVSRLFNIKRAHFIVVDNVTPVPGKPVAPAETNYVSLSEGAEKDNLRVVTIDEKAGTAKVVISGIERIMTLENDGLKIPIGAMQPLPGMVAGPVPGMPPGSLAPTPGMPGMPPNIARAPMPTAVSAMPGTAGAQTSASDINSQLQSIPSRRVRSSPGYQATQPPLTGAQAEMLMQTYGELNRDRINQGLLPPLPHPPSNVPPGQ
jgi:hypothetical protein